ncbi:hypothetical protein CRM22_007131 [Opisthorchis felineus]|uniref:Peptidase A1 domain-containing protein n=1 Tax=Opisthorchis felineus TaxID=147828 RepID=A0A4V3SE35_OPIFE|nr:hypothetical protein CRM22_007131 [Opisthorchis felineus]
MIGTYLIVLHLYCPCLSLQALSLRNETLNHKSELKLERPKRDAYSHALRLHPNGFVYMDIAIGTPPQDLRLEVDTSFGTSLIIAKAKSRGIVYVHYNATASRTKTVSERVCTAIGTRELRGRKNMDVFWIGEYNFMEFNFQMIEQLSQRPRFLDYFSGKLGLAPASEVIPESFAQSLVRLFPDDPVFTLWFRPDADGEYKGGIFSFGGVHEYRYHGNLLYVPLLPPYTFWIVQATKIALGQDIVCQQDCNIQFNTGVPYFYGPQDQIDQIHRLLLVDMDRMSSGAHLLNCRDADSYPLLIIELGGHQFKWRMDELWEMKRDGWTFICKSGMRFSTSLPGWVLGHKLMYTLFTVFDSKNSRIGMAKASRP